MVGPTGRVVAFEVDEALAAQAQQNLASPPWVVAIFSAIGVRDAELSDRLGKVMMAGPVRWQALTRLRRDSHESYVVSGFSPTCQV